MALTLPSFEALSLSLCILLSTYTTYLCSIPPNPNPDKSTHPDSASGIVAPRPLLIRRVISVSLGICHACLCLTYPSPPPLICPRTSHLARYLFTWTPYSIVLIATNLGGCYIRLWAFSALGSNFTFRLAEPRKLITSGLYDHLQHPSYTGKTLIMAANLFLIDNPGGLIGCWLPARLVEAKVIWRVIACLIAFGAIRMMWKRVREEEAMLKSTWGKEWETWHLRTKRFVPGLF
jgi:protein-S-isoprenylcysteine O-methyltransferase Ste14